MHPIFHLSGVSPKLNQFKAPCQWFSHCVGCVGYAQVFTDGSLLWHPLCVKMGLRHDPADWGGASAMETYRHILKPYAKMLGWWHSSAFAATIVILDVLLCQCCVKPCVSARTRFAPTGRVGPLQIHSYLRNALRKVSGMFWHVCPVPGVPSADNALFSRAATVPGSHPFGSLLHVCIEKGAVAAYIASVYSFNAPLARAPIMKVRFKGTPSGGRLAVAECCRQVKHVKYGCCVCYCLFRCAEIICW